MYDRYYQGITRSHPQRERMTESHGAGKLARRVRRGGRGNVQLARAATRRVLTQSVAGWNLNPTAFVWNGERRQRRVRARLRRLGGSGAALVKGASFAA
jgi:hypothetical protein